MSTHPWKSSCAFAVLSILLLAQGVRATPSAEAPSTPSSDSGGAALPASSPPSDAAPTPVEGLTPPMPGQVFLGLSGLFGTLVSASQGLEASWFGGLDVGLRVRPELSLGARRIHYGLARTLVGERHAFGLAPTVELAFPVPRRVQPYAQAGVAMQLRFSREPTKLGIAPFLGGGVRFYIVHSFSLAAEAAAHVVVTDGFLFGARVLPGGTFVLQAGLGLAVHFG